MKVSEITAEHLADYLKLEADEQDMIQMFLSSAIAYVKSYTGLNDEEIDLHNDLVPVIYVLVSDIYENREYLVQQDKVNKLVQSILNMYSKNLL